MAQMVKYFPAMQETWVQFWGREHPLEKRMATHSSIFFSSTPVFLENPMDRVAWWATVHGGHKVSDMTERLTQTLK